MHTNFSLWTISF